MHRLSSTQEMGDSIEEHKMGPKEGMQAVLAERRSRPGHAAMVLNDRASSVICHNAGICARGH